jgi:MYXO-CTERM domain-containing protein
MRALLVTLTLTAGAGSAMAVTVEGTVFTDVDGNGVFSAGDRPLPGVAVFFETARHAVTDAAGRYTLSVAADGQIWARIPDGHRPSPAWHEIRVAEGDRTADLALPPSAASGPVRFVHASDTHIGNGVPLADVRAAFLQATAQVPAPHFFVITGDITGGADAQQFRDLDAALAGVELPFVPVIGNHDIGDGLAYRRELGPPQYSFDQGGVHFIVIDFGTLFGNLPAVLDFIRRDRALSPPGTPTVAFTHMPTDDVWAAALADAGIDYLFTGHWHSNRFVEHGSMLEVNTQMLLSGGLDLTPAGYRVVSWTGEALAFRHATIVDQPVLRVIHPRGAACVPEGPLEVIVAAENGTQVGEITVRVDGGAALAMAPRGGWDHGATVVGPPGRHVLEVDAAWASARVEVCVGGAAPAAALADWTQLGGGPEHHNATARAIEPPLVTLWARAAGGHLLGGAPVVAGGRAFVPVVDLGDNTAGGVLALDARTGAVLWERRTGHAVRNAPAVHGDVVIFGSADGKVFGVDAATGAPRWSYDLGAGLSRNLSWLYAAPAIADGVVYLGVQRRFAALDAATGRELWAHDPSVNGYWLSSYSSAGVSGGVVVAAFARGYDGVVAWDALDGRELWRVPAPLATAVNSAIAIDGETLFFGNSETAMHAVDLVSPMGPRWSRWSKKIVASAHNWTYGIMASAALAGGRVIVPTLFGSLVALDRASGAELWRHGVDPTVFRPVHYMGSGTEAFVAAPLVTGDVVWAGGADGVLYAISLDSGRKLWSVDLGAPVTSGPIPAGDVLLVGTYDGTLQALAHDDGPLCSPDPCPGAEPDDGCAVGGGGGGGTAAALLLLALVRLAARRRRPPAMV